MGRQAKLKKLRKILKNKSLVQELGENFELAQDNLISSGASPTPENLEATFKYLRSIERPDNMTEDEFEAFLEKEMSDFIENNLD